MGFDLTNTGAGVQNKTQDFGETIFGFSYTTVFGAKMTNVFGLAWNYYIAYTKFITGLDLTLDFGEKIEMFYATCFKVGYANEFKASSFKSYTLGGEGFHITGTEEAMTTASTKATAEKTRMDDLVTRSIATETKVVALEDKSGGTSVEVWAISKVITAPTCTIECTAMGGIAVGQVGVVVEPAGVTIIGPLVEIGG